MLFCLFFFFFWLFCKRTVPSPAMKGSDHLHMAWLATIRVRSDWKWAAFCARTWPELTEIWKEITANCCRVEVVEMERQDVIYGHYRANQISTCTLKKYPAAVQWTAETCIWLLISDILWTNWNSDMSHTVLHTAVNSYGEHLNRKYTRKSVLVQFIFITLAK